MRVTESKMISIIIPTLNEESKIGTTLASLQGVSGSFEVLVVDGGSCDNTLHIASELGAKVIHAPKGRGSQLAAGAEAAEGDIFWFLHADTIAPADAIEQINTALRSSSVAGGNFRIRFDGVTRAAKFLTWLHPKVHSPSLSFGDSAIFVRRSIYEEVGGFRSYPLFEDLDLVKRVIKRGRFVRVPSSVITSSRRFSGRNFVATYLLWAYLLLLYKFGVSPTRLATLYRPVR